MISKNIIIIDVDFDSYDGPIWNEEENENDQQPSLSFIMESIEHFKFFIFKMNLRFLLFPYPYHK